MAVFALLERLAPLIESEVKLVLNSKHEAEILKSKLEKIQEGLQDAERQGVTDLSVKRWLRELEGVMYEMDDALDKWEMKNLELKIEQSEYDDTCDPWEKVRSLFFSLCLCFKHVVGRRGITLEMKALSERLDRILEEKGRYSFVPNKMDISRELEKPAETTSAVDKSEVYIGRESEIDSLVELLFSQNGSQVISLVGVGGLGKTTLARLVYNDPRVEQHFKLRAWVSVADPFNALQVAEAIAEAFDIRTSGKSTLENLGQRIKAAVSKQSNRNFLVVLDNVWTVDPATWKSLKSFLVGEPGCRILVTTRDKETAERVGTTHLRRLSLLSNSDCAAILNTIASKGRSKLEEDEKFCKIGFKIAERCNGLPLAAETIGHMLKSRFFVQEWEEVLESPLWRYEDEMSQTFRPLRLSYMDLSPIHKRCFLSCAMFSKGSLIHADDLIRIWMAQGYISSSARWDEVQKKGNDYFEKLSMRSFFQELRRKHDEGDIACKMHDVMLEFANYLAKDEYYSILDSRSTRNTPIDSVGRIHYFCARSVSQEDLPPNFIRLLKHVRVLCLRNCDLKELSEEVGELIHSRYLDLSYNPISKLPETLCDLYNLQTLDLRGCFNLTKLPHGIEKLVKLRHLFISGTSVAEFPPGFQKLTGLWKLDKLVATRDSIGYLRNLNELTGFLLICAKGMDIEASEAEKANLRSKSHLKSLMLVFFDNANVLGYLMVCLCMDIEDLVLPFIHGTDCVSMDVIEAMVPPPELETLSVWGAFAQHLPSWITTVSPINNLKTLEISGFDVCSDNLPPLEKLPMLETLSLKNMMFKKITLEFLGIGTSSVVGGFPKLKKLDFFQCPSWEEWEDLKEEEAYGGVVPVMPCLEELQISFCRKLKALPHSLLLRLAASLHKLTIAHSDGLESRYHKEFGGDRDKISHIPYINISGTESGYMDLDAE